MSQQDPMLASVMASAKERDALIASNTKDNTSANIGALIQGGVNLPVSYTHLTLPTILRV